VLDALAPERGAFAQALEWAGRFRLPVHALVRPGGGSAESQGDAAVMERCARACRSRAITWASCFRNETGALPPAWGDLVIVGAGHPAAEKRNWLRRSLRDRAPAVLFCRDDCQPWSRLLVVHDDCRHGSTFLAAAVEICRRFQATPVILTVARSERLAWSRQREAVTALADRGVSCDYDIMVGSEIRTAVAQAARWRRCQGIMVERGAAPPWWRWWQGDRVDRLVGLAERFSFLAFPGGDTPETHQVSLQHESVSGRCSASPVFR
jgi:hypothetical protein